MPDTHPHHARQPEDVRSSRPGARLEDRVEQLGVPARKLDTADGREEIADVIGDASARSINAIPDAKLHALDRQVVAEQLDDRGRDIISTLQQLRGRGRLQAGLTSVSTAANLLLPGVGIAGAVGSHVLGWNEAAAKKRLDGQIEAFCRMAAASGLDAGRLQETSARLGNPLSKRRLGLRVRSILTTLLMPIARGLQRLVNDGRYAEVQHEVERLMRLSRGPAPAAEERPEPAAQPERKAA